MNHSSVRSFGSFWFPVKIMRFWKLVGLTFLTIWTKHEQNMIQEYLNHLFVKNTWRKLFNTQVGRGPILDFSTLRLYPVVGSTRIKFFINAQIYFYLFMFESFGEELSGTCRKVQYWTSPL